MKIKSQVERELLRKRDILIKLISRQSVIILRRRELPCEFFVATALSGRSIFTSATLQSRVGACSSISFFSSKIGLFLFSPLITIAQKRACRKREQSYSFPAKLLFAYCERRGFRYLIGWRLFVLKYPSGKACHVYKSLEGENSHSFLERVLPL